MSQCAKCSLMVTHVGDHAKLIAFLTKITTHLGRVDLEKVFVKLFYFPTVLPKFQ